ncbi:MAG: PRC-barrel domain-containing protein [Actinobacteria bacterium]|nr:PRC-barrel domain-containing protein [Actinomycetota bacterium]
MRLSDLIRCEVTDEDGVRLGLVSDVRLVQDGPIRAGVQAELRVEALVVGRAGLAERLGYVKHRVRGPWLLRVVFTRLERRARVVPADEVVSWDLSGGLLRVRRGAAERAPGIVHDDLT